MSKTFNKEIFDKLYSKIVEFCNEEIPEHIEIGTLEGSMITVKLTEAAMWLRLYLDVQSIKNSEPKVHMGKPKVKTKEISEKN